MHFMMHLRTWHVLDSNSITETALTLRVYFQLNSRLLWQLGACGALCLTLIPSPSSSLFFFVFFRYTRWLNTRDDLGTCRWRRLQLQSQPMYMRFTTALSLSEKWAWINIIDIFVSVLLYRCLLCTDIYIYIRAIDLTRHMYVPGLCIRDKK